MKRIVPVQTGYGYMLTASATFNIPNPPVSFYVIEDDMETEKDTDKPCLYCGSSSQKQENGTCSQCGAPRK